MNRTDSQINRQAIGVMVCTISQVPLGSTIAVIQVCFSRFRNYGSFCDSSVDRISGLWPSATLAQPAM
jgi:hypothetical protein